jgi:hypothetical protein
VLVAVADSSLDNVFPAHNLVLLRDIIVDFPSTWNYHKMLIVILKDSTDEGGNLTSDVLVVLSSEPVALFWPL